VIVDDSLVPVLAKVKDQLKTVQHIIVAGSGDASALGDTVLRYEDLIRGRVAGFAWPDLDERAAAAMCYTTGTTGDPKGVVYSHRSIYLHTFGVGQASAIPITEKDRILAIVRCSMRCRGGCLSRLVVRRGLVMPGPFLQAEPLARMIATERVTYSRPCRDLERSAAFRGAARNDLSSLKIVKAGGAAVPLSLIERFHAKTGIWITQAGA